MFNFPAYTTVWGRLGRFFHIGLSLADGQSLALLGRNGTGKTTLVNSIVGLTTHKSGTIKLDGRDITRERPERRVGVRRSRGTGTENMANPMRRLGRHGNRGGREHDRERQPQHPSSPPKTPRGA